jgi:hypothetical protein
MGMLQKLFGKRGSEAIKRNIIIILLIALGTLAAREFLPRDDVNEQWVRRYLFDPTPMVPPSLVEH